MSKYIGQTFGRLTVVARLERHKFEFLCSCGNTTYGDIYDVRKGKKRSCGCLHKEIVTKHGHSTRSRYSHEYRCWISMKGRCLSPSNTGYPYYGGRGIGICKCWHSFENFYSDMGPAPSNQHTIERRNVNEDYSPSNCCWATRKEQSMNRRSNRRVEYRDESRPVAEWIEILGLDEELVRSRLKLGWAFVDAVERPVGYYPAYSGTSYKDIAGQRFGRLVAIRKSGTEQKRAMWLCKCDCGTEKIVSGKGLRSGHTTSCGCNRGKPGISKTRH